VNIVDGAVCLGFSAFLYDEMIGAGYFLVFSMRLYRSHFLDVRNKPVKLFVGFSNRPVLPDFCSVVFVVELLSSISL
jgi:hypothetical protein